MDLGLDETQQEIRDLAADVFGRFATSDRVARVESSADRFDAELWSELARTGLLGVAVPEEQGGLGFGMVELALVCQELGRTVAPVPFVPTAVAALAVGGTDLPGAVAAGRLRCAVAPRQSTLGLRVEQGVATGEVVGVPWALSGDMVLLDTGTSLSLLDTADSTVSAQSGVTTGGQPCLHLRLDGTVVQTVGDATAAHRHRLCWLVALAATQAGVTAGALRLAADYTSARHQFGKPLSSFQGVALKAADGYVDTTAIAAVALQAAWALDQVGEEAPDAELAGLTAAWWAAEAGQHCVHVTQHVHGGMGADITYPVHRFFLWGKQIELLVGGASALLADVGDALAAAPRAGDAVVLD